MRRRLFFWCVSACCMATAMAEPVFSSNTFALADVTTSQANTIIAVPWCGYSGEGLPSRVDRLVSPQGLTEGDMLLAVAEDKSYRAWTLESRAWKPIATATKVSADSAASTFAQHDGTGTISRGKGLWLVRQAAGTATLWGIVGPQGATVTVPGGSSAAPSYTLLAAPDVAQALDLKSVTWPSGVDAKDTLVVTKGTETFRTYKWNKTKKAWYYAKAEENEYGIVTTYVYDLDRIPAGTGFWYVRRAADELTLTLP